MSNLTVLVIEDQDEVAKLWRRLLAPLHADVRLASCMAEGIAAMMMLPHPDLVLLDLRLPDSRDPKETLQRIKDLREVNPHAVILVITGMISPAEDLNMVAVQAGADGFKAKLDVTGQDALLSSIKCAYDRRASAEQPTYERNIKLLEMITLVITNLSPAPPQAC